MNDIKRSSRNSRSRALYPHKSGAPVDLRRIDILERKVEAFETFESYNEEYQTQETSRKISPKEYYNRPVNHPTIEEEKQPGRFSLFQKLLFLLGGLILIVFLLWTFVFNGAKIWVTPRTESVVSTGNIFTLINTDANKMYDIVEITKSVQKTIPKTETRLLDAKSSGMITIYNNFSAESQPLIKNTRFEAPDGKIYRIGESITVPGKSGTSPGAITVRVTADTIGDEYNIGPTRFTIPGFKGTSRYDAFHAESTSNMTGGASGEAFVASPQDVADARVDLETNLRSQIRSDLLAVQKDSYIPATSAITFDIIDNADAILIGQTDTYELSGTGKILLIKNNALASLLAGTYITGYRGENVWLRSYSSLSLSLATSTASSTLSLTQPIALQVAGQGTLEYVLDEIAIANALASQSTTQQDFTTIMNGFSGINEATKKISPFWVNSFPKNPNKIQFINNLSQQ